MSTTIEGVSLQNELRPWLQRVDRDGVVPDLRSMSIRDMIYMYLNYNYVPDTSDLLISDSVQIETVSPSSGNRSIVGLVIDDRDSTNSMRLLKNLDTVIVHSTDKADAVRQQLPNVRIVIDPDYKYLNNSNNDSKITDVLLYYDYDTLSDNTYRI